MNLPAKGDRQRPGKRSQKVGKMITDVVEHKLSGVSYRGCRVLGPGGPAHRRDVRHYAGHEGLRKPHTVPELWKLCNVKEEDKPHFQEVLDKLAFLGLLEYDYGYHYDHNGRTAPQSERRYFVPMFVPRLCGAAEHRRERQRREALLRRAGRNSLQQAPCRSIRSWPPSSSV